MIGGKFEVCVFWLYKDEWDYYEVNRRFLEMYVCYVMFFLFVEWNLLYLKLKVIVYLLKVILNLYWN